MKDKRKTGRAGEPGHPDQGYKVTGIRLEPGGILRVTVERPLGVSVPYAAPEGEQDPDTIEPIAVYKPFTDEWTRGE
jgi:hypothetical protein